MPREAELQKGKVPEKDPKDVEATAEAAVEETQEGLPSQAGGKDEPDIAAHSETDTSAAGHKKKKKHTRSKPEKGDVLYEQKMKLYKTGHIERKYKDFNKKYKAADESGRAKLAKELERDQAKLSENYGYCTQLREEGEAEKQKIAGEISEKTGSAMNHINEARKVMANVSQSEQILPLYDEADTALENVRRNREKYGTIAGNAELGKFLRELKAKRELLPNARGLTEAGEKLQLLDAAIAGLSEQYDSLRSEMGPERAARADKLAIKKEKLQVQRDELNKKYNERSPIVRLIRHAMKIKGKSGAVKEEGVDKVAFVDEHITGNAVDMVEQVSKTKQLVKEMKGGNKGNDDDASVPGYMAKGTNAVLDEVLKGKITPEKAEALNTGVQESFNFLLPLWKCFIALRNIRSYFKEIADLSPDERSAKQIEITGSTFEAIISMSEPILDLAQSKASWIAESAPVVGAVLGFAGNAFSALQKIVEWNKSAKYRKAARTEKNKTKEKMAEKRIKYGSDQELKSEGLLSAATQNLVYKKGKIETSSHIEKNSSKRRKKGQTGRELPKTIQQEEQELNSAVGGASSEAMYKRMAELKAKKMEGADGLTVDEKKEYYKMKALKMERDYKEEKETVYVNKKRIRSQVVELVHVALDVAKNIAELCPGLGSLIGQVIGMANIGAKYAHKLFTAIKQKGRDKGWWGDGTKTSAAKEEKRSSMAENMFGQMLFVGGYMKNPEDEPKGTFGDLDSGGGSQVAERMEHLDNGSRSLGFKFSEMYETPNKETLLSKMASAFSTEG